MWDDEQTPIANEVAPGIERITRGDLDALRYRGDRDINRFLVEDDDGAPLPEDLQPRQPRHVAYDVENLRRIRPILFAELYGAGPATLNNIVHQGDHIDLEAYAQHPATAEVNRNGQS